MPNPHRPAPATIAGMSDTALARAAGLVATADSERVLVRSADEAHRAVRALIEDRAGATTVARSWSALGRAALAAAARILSAEAGFWYASGSVGRGEALPGSDLDTLFVRAETSTEAAALTYAARVHDLLTDCGFPGDEKGATAARVRFNRSERDWADGIGRWTAGPAADRGVVMMGLLADAAPVAGGPDLRGRVAAAAREHPDALAAMLQDATYAGAHIPSRLRVLATGDSAVDIKYAAVDPVVRIARWAALSCESPALGTIARVRDATGGRYLDAEDGKVLAQSHAISSSIRWRLRATRWDAGRAVDDRVELSALAPQDRTALRGIGRELDGLRRKLDYLASTSGFSE